MAANSIGKNGRPIATKADREVVIDSSATLAWIYDDERSPPIELLFAEVVRLGAPVPAIWRLEVANGLQQGIRRGRIDKGYRDGALADLQALKAWSHTIKLADEFGLTPFDACYLELANRLCLPLATLDRNLRRAGAALEFELLGV